MVALHFMHYNFARVHKTLRITPAMAAGSSDHVWSLEEIAMLADAAFAPTKRGRYKKAEVDEWRGWLMSESTPRFSSTIKKVIGVILLVLAIALASFSLEARLPVLAVIILVALVSCLFLLKKLP